MHFLFYLSNKIPGLFSIPLDAMSPYALHIPMSNLSQCDASQHDEISVEVVRLFPMCLFPRMCPLPFLPTFCSM